jgi:hypothetical protein
VQRAPDGFGAAGREAVLPLSELTTVAAGYKRTAGFDPAVLNARPSYSARLAGTG